MCVHSSPEIPFPRIQQKARKHRAGYPSLNTTRGRFQAAERRGCAVCPYQFPTESPSMFRRNRGWESGKVTFTLRRCRSGNRVGFSWLLNCVIQLASCMGDHCYQQSNCSNITGETRNCYDQSFTLDVSP
ncbi:hypothetical protein RRG08_037605 [Elysia crispata]|uniref:Uncharacterized protein n=1 Tax=Elysia crispata TaxID=231223 RepID=A0AAE0YHK8_9GAST|nr:hypothetical protein RRG08_037605 [Elysia crispata]